MLTVKYVSPDGEENICECERVVYDRTESDGRPRVLVFDGIPTLAKDNNAGMYCRSGEYETDPAGRPPPLSEGVVYVMNRHGATVATYRL